MHVNTCKHMHPYLHEHKHRSMSTHTHRHVQGCLVLVLAEGLWFPLVLSFLTYFFPQVCVNSDIILNNEDSHRELPEVT